jgi:hypothetical protein
MVYPKSPTKKLKRRMTMLQSQTKGSLIDPKASSDHKEEITKLKEMYKALRAKKFYPSKVR